MGVSAGPEAQHSTLTRTSLVLNIKSGGFETWGAPFLVHVRTGGFTRFSVSFDLAARSCIRLPARKHMNETLNLNDDFRDNDALHVKTLLIAKRVSLELSKLILERTNNQPTDEMKL